MLGLGPVLFWEPFELLSVQGDDDDDDDVDDDVLGYNNHICSINSCRFKTWIQRRSRINRMCIQGQD